MIYRGTKLHVSHGNTNFVFSKAHLYGFLFWGGARLSGTMDMGCIVHYASITQYYSNRLKTLL